MEKTFENHANRNGRFVTVSWVKDVAQGILVQRGIPGFQDPNNFPKSFDPRNGCETESFSVAVLRMCGLLFGASKMVKINSVSFQTSGLKSVQHVSIINHCDHLAKKMEN